MNMKERVASVRRDVARLATKLVNAARPGHIEYTSKRDAGHVLTRLEAELERIEAQLSEAMDNEPRD